MKNIEDLLILFENLNNTNEKKLFQNFENFEKFLNSISVLCINFFNKSNFSEKNKNNFNLQSFILSEFQGTSQKIRNIEKEMFSVKYDNEKEIEEDYILLNKKLNQNWIFKIETIFEELINLFNKIKQNNYNYFKSNSYNFDLALLIQDTYSILEPLTKEIVLGSFEKEPDKMNLVFKKLSSKFQVNPNYIEFLIQQKNKYINKSKHNNNSQNLNPYKQIVFAVFEFCFLNYLFLNFAN